MITVPGGTLKPNVIIYVIDGGGADYMSAYGYPYRTTPALEALAAEGALFERAYSNASWTRPSVASLMTSLHSTVLAFRDLSDAVPQHALTMGERFHDLGYATAVFSSNPWAGFASGLSAGLDFLSSSSVANGFTASASLNANSRGGEQSFQGLRSGHTFKVPMFTLIQPPPLFGRSTICFAGKRLFTIGRVGPKRSGGLMSIK